MKPSTVRVRPVPAVRLTSALMINANDSLSWVAHAARDLLIGVDCASIVSIQRGQALRGSTSTDPSALKADLLQSELGEGPGVAIAAGEPLVQCSELVTDSRWPAYGAQAAQLGLRSQTAPVSYTHLTLPTICSV